MSTASEILLERVRAATADEYTIEGEIGRGGMAAVFLAHDIALQRRVAIKVMLPDLIDVAGIQDRFVIEARTAAHLDHPGIVTVYSVKQRAGLLFIVMKYLEGRTLEALMHGGRAHDPAVVTAVVKQVAEALQFAHAEGVVHRDVKPSNIIIDTRGRPVVTDFGIAKVLAARSITIAGSMLGTPAYMSPEQCRGLTATGASDQYALGVMTYEMLTGRVPFTGTTFELISAHCAESPQPLRELVPGIDPALGETVMRMLAKNPSDRWGSLGEVALRLGENVRGQPSPPELRDTIAAFARGEPTLAPDPGAVTVNIPAATREAVTTPTDNTPSVAPVVDDMRPAPRNSMSRGMFIAGVAIVLAAAVLLYQGSRQRATVLEPAKPAEALQLRDSARVTTRDTTPPPPPTPDSSRAAPVTGATAARHDSAGTECPKFLERVSLGEKLTGMEDARFKRLCTK